MLIINSNLANPIPLFGNKLAVKLFSGDPTFIINLTGNFVFTKRPRINLANVPEFPASIIVFFLILKPFNPKPSIL